MTSPSYVSRTTEGVQRFMADLSQLSTWEKIAFRTAGVIAVSTAVEAIRGVTVQPVVSVGGSVGYRLWNAFLSGSEIVAGALIAVGGALS